MPLLTTKEAATLLGMSRRRVQKLCAEGRVVGSRKVGRDYVIDVPVGGVLSVTGLVSVNPVTGVTTRVSPAPRTGHTPTAG